MVLYRKYRPQTLADIVGQETVVKTLLSQLASGKISHAYLFAGPRGTGKTSTARIFAKAVNCQGIESSESGSGKLNPQPSTLNPTFGEPCNKCQSCIAITEGSHLDVIEIDAASNRGIDEMRDLRERIKLSPVGGRYKVYIIDEVHMLTTEAFNALLKTLEEPPAHAIFILCTTEVAKLPATILSRLARFHFAKATDSYLKTALGIIAKNEKITISNETLAAIISASEGSYRDAVSLLDQVSLSENLEADSVSASVIFGSSKSVFTFVGYLARRDLRETLGEIQNLVGGGVDITNFTKEVILTLENILLAKIESRVKAEFDSDRRAKINELSGLFTFDDLLQLMKLLLVAEGESKIYPLGHISLTIAVSRYCGEPVESRQSTVESSQSRKDVHNTQHVTRDTKLKTIDDSVGQEDKNIKGIDGIKGAEGSKKANENKVHETKSLEASDGNLHLTIEQVEEKWEALLGKLKPVNAHVVALLRSCKPRDVDGMTVSVEVFYRFHKDKLYEPKILRMINQTLDELIGVPVRLQFVLADKLSKPPQVVKASNVVEVNQNELADIAQEIFSK